MNSQEVLDIIGAKIHQEFLWDDYDNCLLKTPFKDTGDRKLNQQIAIHWWMNVYTNHNCEINQDVYNSWCNACNNFDFVKADGSYNIITNQSTVCYSPYKKELPHLQLEEFELWLPHIKWVEPKKDQEYMFRHYEGRKFKYIDIFEQTLSEFGIWEIYYYSDSEIDINFSYAQPKKFTNLKTVVEYCCNNLYYKKRLA